MASCPDIAFTNKHITAFLNDIAVPRDDNIVDKRIENVKKHRNLATELKGLWQKKIAVVPIVVACKGAAEKIFTRYNGKITGKINIFEI